MALNLSELCFGQKIRVTETDGHVCEGEVKCIDFDRRSFTLKKCRNLPSRTVEPGDSIFLLADVKSWKAIEKRSATSSSAADARAPPPDKSPAVSLPTESKKTARGPMVSENRRREDRLHLSRLYPLDMKDLLSQGQIAPPPELVQLEEGVKKIPKPKQSAVHVEADQFQAKENPEFVVVRDVYWVNQMTPPPMTCVPGKMVYVDAVEDDLYSSAMDTLTQSSLLGVSLEGQCLGRRGKLSLVCLATKETVYVFDIIALGPRIFDDDLRFIFESDRIMKVLHDCRQASDLLHHQHEIKLSNVFDTLAAHSLFMTTAMYSGFLPANAPAVTSLARSYLGVEGASLFFPHYRRSHLKEDTGVWLERPLTKQLQFGAVSNAMFLLELQRATRVCMTSYFHKGVSCLLSSTRDASDLEADIRIHGRHLLPPEFKDTLPKWEPNSYKAEKWGFVDRGERRVFQSAGQIDPNVVFSRDVLHQNKPNKLK